MQMKSTYNVSEAQSRLPRLLKEAENGQPVCIRRHNEVVAYVVSRERMEAIVETMEILANPEAMKAIRAHRAKKTSFVPLTSLDEDE
jgi:antitoxin YefM